MEFVIGLVVLLVVGGFVATGLAGAGLAAKESRGRSDAAASTTETLDALFATAAATVSYDTRPYNALRPTPVIEGALQRGWELVHDERGQLLFKRA